MILLDTNILLRLKNIKAPEHQVIQHKIEEFIDLDVEIVICPQSLYEFYVVATRPIAQNGFGLNEQLAISEIDNLLLNFQLLPETNQVYNEWYNLLKNYSINGKLAHDARLVAWMLVHQVKQIYTLNKVDFQRFGSLITCV
jgi:predicted nucleic acid-binding protein